MLHHNQDNSMSQTHKNTTRTYVHMPPSTQFPPLQNKPGMSSSTTTGKSYSNSKVCLFGVSRVDFLVFLFSPEFFCVPWIFCFLFVAFRFHQANSHDAMASWRSSLIVISVLHGVQSAFQATSPSLPAYPHHHQSDHISPNAQLHFCNCMSGSNLNVTLPLYLI